MSAAAVDRQGTLSMSGLPPVASRCGSQLDALASPEPSVYATGGEGSLTGWLPALDEKDMLINRMQFVEPSPKRPPVPNHILDSKIYSTVIRNKFVEANPPVLNFAGFEVGDKARRLKLDIINLSGDVQRMHVIPPQTKYFRIEYTKNKRMVPGFAVSCVIEFRPDEYRYYYDCVRVHSKGEDNLIIPIHAFPVMNTSDFPKFIDFAMVPVGESRTRVIPLRCEAPINFEFELTFTQIHPSFTVDPVAGTVPANGEVDVTVTFTPTSFQTATAKLQLSISQFLSKPLICSLFGCSAPGLSRDLALATVRNATLPSGMKLDVRSDGTLDPGMLSPLARSRSRKYQTGTATVRLQAPTEQQPTGQIVQRDGLVIPPHLNTPHAVATVLNQKRGQLRMKDLQEAMQLQKSGTVPMSRQMKETMFESAVRQNVYEERQNQLRWQVKLGDEPATAEYQDKIFWDRDRDWDTYKRLRGDPEADEESRRYENLVLMRRTRRDASEVAPPVATFDTFLNNMWATRHAIITRFQQAAYKVIIRNRMTTRLRGLQKYHRESSANDKTTAVIVASPTTACTSNSAADLASMKFDASDVRIITFPFYVSPTVRDDLAVDALGPVSLVSGPVRVKTDVPYFPLQVPQHSRLCGYTRYDVQAASLNYVKPASNRRLRTGDEDDQALVQVKQKSQTDSTVGEQRRDVDASAAGEPTSMASVTTAAAAAADAAAAAAAAVEPCTAAALSSALRPPPAMLQPVKYHPLHIFNPAPGLLTLHTPLPYSVTDPDFHVCPLPRFADCGVTANHQYTASQKCFLDRQEVIKGVMTWRKFSDTSLVASAGTPTLSNVWVPRWGEAFNTELLPLESPPLLRGLDDEDRKYVVENDGEIGAEGEVQVHLTMEMVKAEFAAMEKACLHEGTKDDAAAAAAGKKMGNAPASPASTREVFPAGRKLPPTNLPSNAAGPVPRARLEADLQTFLQRKRNNLGRRIDSRLGNLEELAKDKSLISK